MVFATISWGLGEGGGGGGREGGGREGGGEPKKPLALIKALGHLRPWAPPSPPRGLPGVVS